MKKNKNTRNKETEQLTVKMATIGRVPEFEATKEDFDSYLERFECWLAANEIKDEKKQTQNTFSVFWVQLSMDC